MATIYEVADLAGVSIATVSNVINKNGNVAAVTEQKVLDAIEKLNYVPGYVTRVAKSGLLKNIGVIAEDISSPMSFSALMIRGVSEYCENHSYRLQLEDLNLWRTVKKLHDYDLLENDRAVQKKKENTIQSLIDTGVRGIIYIGDHPRATNMTLPDIDIPLTVVYSYTGNKCYSINANDVQGGKIATEYLIEQGHKKIGIITGSTNSLPSHRRFIAYQETLMKYWLTFNPDYVQTGNWRFEDGYDGCKKLMSLPDPPTAIFAMNDRTAYGVLSYAHKNGIRIPEDLSVIGFDDLELSRYYYPPLTTVNLPFSEMGYRATELLIQIIEGQIDTDPSQIQEQLMDCSLIVRETVRPPRKD